MGKHWPANLAIQDSRYAEQKAKIFPTGNWVLLDTDFIITLLDMTEIMLKRM